MRPRDDLGLEPDAPDADELFVLADRLEQTRPVPPDAFRGALRRRLLAEGVPAARPARLRLLVAGCASSGTALLLIAAASLAGIGPLAA